METILGIMCIIAVLLVCYSEIDKKRVEEVVENKSDHYRPKTVDNVVYVAKDKEEANTTAFAIALKEAMQRQKGEV